MALSDNKFREYQKRLLLARMRILLNNGFYGLLLMHMIFAIDEECKNVASDNSRIYFNPEFLDSISDSELDFVMMHEILHIALRHNERIVSRDLSQYDIACDIVVNSNIMHSNNDDERSITLKKYGTSIHLTPNNDEGYKYTSEEVYDMLVKINTNGNSNNSNNKDELPIECKNNENNRLPKNKSDNHGNSGPGYANHIRQQNSENYDSWDDHSRWKSEKDDTYMREVWIKRNVDAAEAIRMQEASNSRGTLPLFAQILLKDLKKPQTDWRTILTDFIQEEICDYSFSPPDRRFDDSPFYLPDFNEKEYIVSDILFMIDTSGSMSDEMITAAYSEVKGAIDQFDGKLKGWLGFFDAAIIEPAEFKNEDEFRIIKPAGGGGTDFQIIFEYVHQHMTDNPPASIIILTDGYAPFPNQASAESIPVLWLLNNEEVNPPWGKVARIKL